MLLNLKQMVGRLIRSEDDRGIVVLVESRPEKRYFRRLGEALPPGSRVILAEPEDLARPRSPKDRESAARLGPFAGLAAAWPREAERRSHS